MALVPQRPKERETTLSTLNVLIDGLNDAKDISSITPAQAAFGSVSALLVMIRVRFLLLRDVELLGHIYLGLHAKPAGLRRPRDIMR